MPLDRDQRRPQPGAAGDADARDRAAAERDRAADGRDRAAARRSMRAAIRDELEDRDLDRLNFAARTDARLDREASAADRRGSAADRSAAAAEQLG
jgi:hypothetical protein